MMDPIKRHFLKPAFREKNISRYLVSWSILYSLRKTNYLSIVLILISINLSSQTEFIKQGSFIINMGVTPQTVGNGLKPYGMIYDLIKNHKVGVIWSINPNKDKDGIDFIHNGIVYRGGPFIIPVEFRTAAVNARITYWQGQGVVGATTVSDMSVPVHPQYGTLKNVPRWTLDKKNGGLAIPYFSLAGIPPDAHGGTSGNQWKDPAELDCCDDLFVLPHADPIWSSHGPLWTWNQTCKGGIWNGCHSGSSLENMVNPANRSQQTNFLCMKDPAFTGTSGNYATSNSLILWGGHSDGSPPYNHRLPADPVAQYMGSTDAAYQNGAEQIFIPRQTAGTSARWNPGAKVIVYDPTHVNVPSPQGDLRNTAALVIYGKAFDDNNRGYVMHNAGHRMNRGNQPANIAAMRIFFNYSWIVASDKAELVEIVTNGNVSSSGSGNTVSFDLPSGNINDFTIEWFSSCGGSLSPNAAQQTLVFTPPPATDLSGCALSVSITDNCGRTTTASFRFGVQCDYNVIANATNPLCAGASNGRIDMNISGFSAVGANEYTWERENPAGNGSGTGESIQNLIAGTYHVTVTSFTGCSATFTSLVAEPRPIQIDFTERNYECFGQSGSVNVSVSGGIQPYSYDWGGGIITRNRSDLSAGEYTLTVSDANGCTSTQTAVITGPGSGIDLSLNKTDVTCFSANNGSIITNISGGQGPYSYTWSDGASTQNRSNLAPGTYLLTVTDIAGCAITGQSSITQPAILAVNISVNNPSCPTNGTAPLNNDGAINITVSGGTAPYQYLWNDNITTEDRTGLPEGTYNVTITDARGCQLQRTITLTPLSGLPGTPNGINR
jgi:hypothetical protein